MNGRLLDNGHYLVGNTVQYFCSEGFVLIGEPVIRCTESGLWSHAPPFCKFVIKNKLSYLYFICILLSRFRIWMIHFNWWDFTGINLMSTCFRKIFLKSLVVQYKCLYNIYHQSLAWLKAYSLILIHSKNRENQPKEYFLPLSQQPFWVFSDIHIHCRPDEQRRTSHWQLATLAEQDPCRWRYLLFFFANIWKKDPSSMTCFNLALLFFIQTATTHFLTIRCHSNCFVATTCKWVMISIRDLEEQLHKYWKNNTSFTNSKLF